jgi:hypothetical protein
MSVIKRQIPWTRKPSYPSKIKSKYGFKQVFDFTTYKNLVGSEVLTEVETSSSDVTIGINKYGHAGYINTTANTAGFKTTKPFDQDATNYTFHVAFQGSNFSSTNNLVQYEDGIGTGRGVVYVNNAGLISTFLDGTANSGTTTLSENTLHIASIRKSNTSIKIWVDGILEVNVTLTADSANGDIRYGCHKSDLNNLRGYLSLAIANDIAEPEAQILSLHKDIYQIYQPRIQDISYSTAAAGTTINASTAAISVGVNQASLNLHTGISSSTASITSATNQASLNLHTGISSLLANISVSPKRAVLSGGGVPSVGGVDSPGIASLKARRRAGRSRGFH